MAVADGSDTAFADGSTVGTSVSVGTAVADGAAVEVGIAVVVGNGVTDAATVAVGGKVSRMVARVDVGRAPVGREAV